MRNWLKAKIIFLLIVIFILTSFDISIGSTSKKNKTSTQLSKSTNAKKVTKKNQTKKSNKKKTKKRRKPRIVFRKVALNYLTNLETKTLAEGVVYKKVQFGKEPLKIIVHLVEVDFDSLPNNICVLKAKNNINSLDYLKNIFDDYYFELTRINEGQLLALVNANFWSAYMNYPIGLLISDGEIISMKKYKEWSSVLFDYENRPYIDNFDLSGEIIFSNNYKFKIDNVNKRTEKDEVVMYNKYFGDSVPKIYLPDLEKLVNQTINSIKMNMDIEDTSEIEVDTNEIIEEIVRDFQLKSKEFSTLKYIFRYLEKPAINKKVKVELMCIDTGIVSIPSDGFVVCVPNENSEGRKLKKGEVAEMYFYTDKLRYIEFENGVSGTPRLVRKGVARHEAYQEGSRGYRFIGSQLSRTGLGTNMSKTKLFLFFVESSKSSNSVGSSLLQLAIIAKKLGCYDAINLDGGGSSGMIIGGERVCTNGNANRRKISAAIGVTKISK